MFVTSPADLVARPCSDPAERWHLEQLDAGSNDPLRTTFHQKWLAHLGDSNDEVLMPRVSVVIPVYDAVPWVQDAVASVMVQTWPRVECVVIDDGSSDDLETALRPFGEGVRIVHQDNAGVAAARNRGVQEATGEYVHFLDADDLLDPGCIAAKVAAFRHVADAEVCTSLYRVVGENEVKSEWNHSPPSLKDSWSPTRDLLITALQRFPLHMSTVMAPRFTLLDAGLFDERLRHSEDARFGFRLGLRGTKVIGLNRAHGTRRFIPGSLTSRLSVQYRGMAAVGLMNLLDLLEDPELWPYVGQQLRRLRNSRRWKYVDRVRDPLLDELRDALVDRLQNLPAGPSPAPLLRMVHNLVIRAPGDENSLLRPHLLEASAASATTPSLSDLDVRIWTMDNPFSDSIRPALSLIRAWIETRMRADPSAVTTADLRDLSRTWPEHPGRVRWRLIRGLAPLVGMRRAIRVAGVLDRARSVSRLVSAPGVLVRRAGRLVFRVGRRLRVVGRRLRRFVRADRGGR